MAEMPDDEAKRNLEKIKKKLMKSEELGVEASRRYQVANEKMAGYLIEFIESQRDKLKEKGKLGRLLGILLRISDLRTQVITEVLREQSLKKLGPLNRLSMIHAIHNTDKMVEVYRQIGNDLTNFFYHEDSKSLNLLYLNILSIEPESKLIQLNVCLGQLQGLVLGRLYEFVF